MDGDDGGTPLPGVLPLRRSKAPLLEWARYDRGSSQGDGRARPPTQAGGRDDALVDPAAGIRRAHCVDLATIRELRGDPDLTLRPRPTRAGCGCVESRDIGTYDTCPARCLYCYANAGPRADGTACGTG